MGLRDRCAWLWDRDPAPASMEMLPNCLGPPALWVSTPDTQCSVPASRVAGIQRGSVAPAAWAGPAPGADPSLLLCP